MPLVEAFQSLTLSQPPGGGSTSSPSSRFEPTALQLLQTISQAILRVKGPTSPLKQHVESPASLELEEFTLVNRDLYLWCDALAESHLQIDVFLCTHDLPTSSSPLPLGPTPHHTLLERWTLRGSPLAPPTPKGDELSSSLPSSSPLSMPFAHNVHNSPNDRRRRDTTEDGEGLAMFGKYLSSLIESSDDQDSVPKLDKLDLRESNEAESIYEDNVTHKLASSTTSLEELHSYMRTMPLHEWLRNNTFQITQSYGTPRSNHQSHSFSTPTETIDFPPFVTRCSSFSLSVTYTQEIDWDMFHPEDRRKITLVTAPSRSWSTASCHAKYHHHHSHPQPASLPRTLSRENSFEQERDSDSYNPLLTPPSSPPQRSFAHQLQQYSSSLSAHAASLGKTPSSKSIPSSFSSSASPSIPSSQGFVVPSSPSPSMRSPTKPLPMPTGVFSSSPGYTAEFTRVQGFAPTSASLSSAPSPSPSTSLRSPSRAIPIIPITVPVSSSLSGYPPLGLPSTSPHTTPPRSMAIRIPGSSRDADLSVSPSSSAFPHSPSPSASSFHYPPSPSPTARRALFRSPAAHSATSPPVSPSPSSVDLMGSFAGSFQESILLGHMSNTSSTTFPGFIADLGVSGKDFIPPHKRIPFPAVFYHIDPDTPYVGTVELGEKGYKVPQKGLIQLTIFNPKNTPVKTFLVNFDLTGMTPDTKTFLRQKIVTNDPPILRYAIHLRFVCPKRKRYYLYNNIRVVFPHRVPDEMEKLKVIYDSPSDPKFFPCTESFGENSHH